MAQQTINVGTAPNDGTGTPLRTAFQYTNSNFSELYTAVGPSGNNIVVPGSATITGDLTVDTNTLKVDSANDRVGIGTASPTEALEVSNGGNIKIGGFDQCILGAGGGGAKMQFSNGANDLDLYGGSTGRVRLYTASTERYRIASDGVATWSNVGGVAGTAMTLNSTGLGVGVASPAAKVHVVGGAAQNPLILDSTGYNHCVLKVSGTNRGQFYADATNCFAVVNSAGSATPFVVTDTGNVGIGGNASVTGIDTGVARLFVVAPNSNTGMAATFIADSVGRGLLVADQSKTNSFGVEVVAGLVKTGGFTSGTSVALFANAVERARVKSTGQVRFVPLAADPSGAEAGDVYYNSSSNKLKCYNGTTWNDLF